MPAEVDAPTSEPASPSRAPAGTRLGGLGSLVRALSHRNYRLFFIGQGVSLIGTWMQRIALQWLVYRLTGSAAMLGAIGFAGQIPSFLLAPLAGVLSDRWDLRRVVVVTQVLALLQALLLAGLTLSNTVAIWHLFALSIGLGFINAFDMPARQAFVVQMLDRPADLPNAIALNSFLVNGARLLGPTLAGALIALVGEGICFLLNGLSYVPVIFALLAMTVVRRKKPAAATHILGELRDGFAYAWGFPPIRGILLLLSVVSLVGMPYTILMPIFASDVLRGGPQTLGFLMAAVGCGAIAGAFALARRTTVVGLGKTIAGAATIFGAGLVAFSFSSNLGLSLALLLATGFAMMLQMASSNTVLQTIVDDDKRGRLMSFYTMSFMGMAPFGSLLAGLLAHAIGAPRTLMLGGAACVVAGLLFGRRLPAWRPLVQPIYVRKGVIPSPASVPQ